MDEMVNKHLVPHTLEGVAGIHHEAFIQQGSFISSQQGEVVSLKIQSADK
jgi:hypothetical protein